MSSVLSYGFNAVPSVQMQWTKVDLLYFRLRRILVVASDNETSTFIEWLSTNSSCPASSILNTKEAGHPSNSLFKFWIKNIYIILLTKYLFQSIGSPFINLYNTESIKYLCKVSGDNDFFSLVKINCCISYKVGLICLLW